MFTFDTHFCLLVEITHYKTCSVLHSKPTPQPSVTKTCPHIQTHTHIHTHRQTHTHTHTTYEVQVGLYRQQEDKHTHITPQKLTHTDKHKQTHTYIHRQTHISVLNLSALYLTPLLRGRPTPVCSGKHLSHLCSRSTHLSPILHRQNTHL